MKYRILLVDDEVGIAEGLKVLLEGMEKPFDIVGIAEDGVQGIEMAHELRPDVIVTDIRMPVMDGLHMIEKLTSENMPCRFVVLSGFAEFEYAKKAMSMGVSSYVTKPVDEDELAEEIEKNAHLVRTLESEPEEPFTAIRKFVDENFAGDVSLNELSRRFFLNPVYISQLFKKKTGMTYQSYVTACRIDKARELLETTGLMVYEVSERVGYSDTVYFSRVFEKQTGVRPSEWKNREHSH